MIQVEPEHVLPEQLLSPRKLSGTERLVRACLLQAVDTLRGRTHVKIVDFDDDYDWLTCENEEPFTFLHLCSVLDLNAESFRADLIASADAVRRGLVGGKRIKRCRQCKKIFGAKGRFCSAACEKKYRKPKAGIAKHGTRRGYRLGCRCLVCKDEDRKAQRLR